MYVFPNSIFSDNIEVDCTDYLARVYTVLERTPINHGDMLLSATYEMMLSLYRIEDLGRCYAEISIDENGIEHYSPVPV